MSAREEGMTSTTNEDSEPPAPPTTTPRTLKIGTRGKGFSYITYTPGLEEKASIEAELKREVCDQIESSNLYKYVGLSPLITRNELLSCVSKHFSSLPARYCLDNKAEDVVRHMKLLNKPITGDQVAVSCYPGKTDGQAAATSGAPANNNIVLITVVCCDRPKIYNRITFGLDKFVLSTLDADIMTTNTGKVSSPIPSLPSPTLVTPCRLLIESLWRSCQSMPQIWCCWRDSSWML
jgi:hypothetical protein